MSFTTGAGGDIAGALGNILDEALAFVAIFSTSAMVETLLYGIHLILFCICIFLLLRNRRLTQWFISISAVVMFVLSTADIAITFRVISYVVPRLADPKIAGITTKLIHAKTAIFVADNFVAELILLYRCYMIWGRSKYILAGCSLLVVADTIWGFLGVGPALGILTPEPNRFIPVYIWSILAINIVLTLIAVCRIFWISRIAKRLVGQKQISVYHTAIAILVESSLIYSICILFYVLLPFSNPYRVTIVLMAMRVVAIMPTLLIVQVGLGAVVKEIDLTTPMTSRFEVRPNSVVLSTIGSLMLHANQHPETIFRNSPHDEEAAGSSQTIELIDVSKSKTATFEDRRPRTVDYANHAATH
ncbi:hypothetical protein BJ912DRAFT_961536 [Pholiota molesta]|nr:hypothetical protein BJ912DRAFT_961536 [Pholiota molesta]